MIRAAWRSAAAGLIVCAPIAPAAAQRAADVGVEAATDEARRGLSWTGGRATVSGDLAGGIGPIDASARVVALRGAARHGGADAVADLALTTRRSFGPVSLTATGIAHVFAGTGRNLDYIELGGSGGYTLGPVQLVAGALVAPSQRSIGGSNVYVYAGASAGLPGTPLSLVADVGHSSGSVTDPATAQRLRPGGDYADWRVGTEHRRGRLTLALDYVGTDIARVSGAGPFADPRHFGDRIVGRARLGF